MKHFLHGLLTWMLVCHFDSADSLACYSRNATIGTNGSISSCGPSETSCYAYSMTTDYAGCGSCSSYTASGYSCSACSTDLCNYKVPIINCYATKASISFSSRTKTTCSGYSSCYQYSYTSIRTDFFFAGCGDCSSYIAENPTCTNCTTDYCNSGTRLCFQPISALIASAITMTVWVITLC